MTGILCSLPMIGAPTAATSGGGGGGGGVSNADAVGTGSTDNIITNTVTATGGGVTTKFSWERVSGDSSIIASRPFSASTSFQRNNCEPGTSYSAIFRCRVESSAHSFTYSPNVSVLITRTA